MRIVSAIHSFLINAIPWIIWKYRRTTYVRKVNARIERYLRKEAIPPLVESMRRLPDGSVMCETFKDGQCTSRITYTNAEWVIVQKAAMTRLGLVFKGTPPAV